MTLDTLVDPFHVPPGGWRYIQPQTGMKIKGGDFFNLCHQVRTHRQLNKLPTAGLEAQVQAYICENLKEEARILYCRSSQPLPTRTMRKVAFADVKHFLQTLGNLRSFVSQAEAERRAGICAKCPLNHPISGCTSCRNLPALVFKVIGRRSTSADPKLGACSVCGCSLAASVHVPLAAFPEAPHYEFPEWCWHSLPPS